jgi:CRP/FNR family transcriptional regulator, cyclic AMP receptor protein
LCLAQSPTRPNAASSKPFNGNATGCHGPPGSPRVRVSPLAISSVVVAEIALSRARASPFWSVRQTMGKLEILRNHSIFGKLPRTMIERLGSQATTRRVRRGKTIFTKGDAGTELMAVLSGSVKISVSAADGRETVLNVIHKGEIFGEIALLDGRPRTADAIAMSDCELMIIERRDFIPFVREHPEVALKLIEILCTRLRRTSAQVEDVMYLNLPARLARAVLRLADESGGAFPRKISVTQREISQMIGMSRESTNKQLRTWVRAKWVMLERGGIVVIRPDALANIAARGLESELA